MSNLVKQQILDHTDGGRDVFMFYIDNPPKSPKKAFKLRDERTPSAHIKRMADGVYYLNDFGDNAGAINCFDFVGQLFDLTFVMVLRQIIRDLQLPIELGNKDIRDYKHPEIKNKTGLSDEVLAGIFLKRGIRQKSVQKFDLFSTPHFIARAKKELNCIAMPYYEGGKVVNVKYRGQYKDSEGTMQKAYELHKNGKRTFYNLDALHDKAKEVILVEGEFDCIAVWQAIQGDSRLKNVPVISVSNGVNSLDDNIHFALHLLKGVQKWFIFVDDDVPGVKLQEEFKRRMGPHKCLVVPKYGYKDANEMLVGTDEEWQGKERTKETVLARVEKGEELIVKAIQNAVAVKVEGHVKMSNVRQDVLDRFNGAVIPTTKAGFDRFDKLYAFSPFGTTTWTGIPGHGKSTFLNNIAAMTAIREGTKWGFFSSEFANPVYHIDALLRIISGAIIANAANHPDNKDYISEDELLTLLTIYEDNFHFLYPDNIVEGKIVEVTKDWLWQQITALVETQGINAFVIDPYSTITNNTGKTEAEFINIFLKEATRLSYALGIHIHIVAHPTKISKDLKFEDAEGKVHYLYRIPDAYSISGTAGWYNHSFNIASVYRHEVTGESIVTIWKNKFEGQTGKKGSATFSFDLVSNRYLEIDEHGMPKNTWITMPASTSSITKADFFELAKSMQEDGEVPF